MCVCVCVCVDIDANRQQMCEMECLLFTSKRTLFVCGHVLVEVCKHWCQLTSI